MKRTVFWMLAVAVGTFGATLSFGQTNSYISATDGFWDEARLWSLAAPPSITQSWIFITNAASVNVTIDSVTASEFPETLTISNLTINPQGNTSTIYLDNTGTVALHILAGLTIGTSPDQHPVGTASFISSNSTLIVDGLGGQILDNGTMVIAGGSLIATTASLVVGSGEDDFQTSLLLSNATVQVGSLNLAQGSEGPNAAVEVFGRVTTLSGSLIVGESNLGGGANMTVDGGALLVVTNGDTGIGTGFQAGGLMTVTNATFLARSIYLPGERGGAILFINNGTVALNGSLSLGQGDEASGSVYLNGGALIVTNGDIYIGAGDPSSGNELSVNGLFLARNVYVSPGGESEGSLDIYGGTTVINSNLVFGYRDINGGVSLFGGQLIVTNAPIIVDYKDSMGVSDGQLIAQSIVLGQSLDEGGTLSVSGGSITVSGGITVGNCSEIAPGNLVVGGGTTTITNAAHTGYIDLQYGTLTLNNGTLQVDQLIMTNGLCVIGQAQFIHTGGTLLVGQVILDPNMFQILSVTRQSNDVLVSWLMAPGATNALQAANGGVNGSYSTNNFFDIFIVTNNTTAGTLTNFLDIGGATNKPSRYYRARLGL